MKSSNSRSTLVLVAALSYGCGGEPECFGWEEGKRYTVDVLERYDANSSFQLDQGSPAGNEASCGAEVEPLVGGTLVVIPTNLTNGNRASCNVLTGKVEPVPPVDITTHGSHPISTSDRLVATYIGRFGACQAVWLYRFYAPEGGANVLKEPQVGQVPPVVLERVITETNDSQQCDSGTSCSDHFVVHITKQ